MAGTENRGKEKEAENVAPPFSLTHNPDGTPKLMTIRMHGVANAGTKRVTEEEWRTKYGNPKRFPVGTWEVVGTELISPYHDLA